ADALHAALATRVGDDERHTGLFRVGGRNRRNGLPGRRLERSPEVGRGGVAVGLLLHVAADTVAEGVFSQKIFNHTDDRRTLAVGDDVEDRARLGFVRDWLLN